MGDGSGEGCGKGTPVQGIVDNIFMISFTEKEAVLGFPECIYLVTVSKKHFIRLCLFGYTTKGCQE